MRLSFAAFLFASFTIAALVASPAALAKDYLVETQKAYKKAAKTLKPGDTIILKNGEWTMALDLKTGIVQPVMSLICEARTIKAQLSWN